MSFWLFIRCFHLSADQAPRSIGMSCYNTATPWLCVSFKAFGCYSSGSCKKEVAFASSALPPQRVARGTELVWGRERTPVSPQQSPGDTAHPAHNQNHPALPESSLMGLLGTKRKQKQLFFCVCVCVWERADFKNCADIFRARNKCYILEWEDESIPGLVVLSCISSPVPWKALSFGCLNSDKLNIAFLDVGERGRYEREK